MQKIYSFLFLLLVAHHSWSQQHSIIPLPVSVAFPEKPGSVTVKTSSRIYAAGSGMERSISFLNSFLARHYNMQLAVTTDQAQALIHLNYEKMEHPVPGAYSLTVNPGKIQISGDNEEGVFYGIQTLLQLLRPGTTAGMTLTIDHITVRDAPNFAYRGLHLDVARHFKPLSFVKQYIDYIASHKMNYFHWHLTDDQGWRIQIKKYPALTETGARRNGTITGRYPGTGNDETEYGGYYTQEEIKEVVAYAKQRYVTVIPEIEMPGHAGAAIAAYPWLSCFPGKKTVIPENKGSKKTAMQQQDGRVKVVQESWGVFDDVFCAGKDSTFSFLQDVMDEVLGLFPSAMIHIGGDECPKTHWKLCPACQNRMQKNKLKDEHELQSYFIQRMEKYINSKGRTIIGWDEILEGGLAPNAIVMSWRGEKGGITAARQGHKVIMSPGSPLYFDHNQTKKEDSVTIGGFNPIEKVYAYNPVPAELSVTEARYILGAQANMWSEYMKTPEKVNYMLFPRIAALSEILWTPPGLKNWDDFNRRLRSLPLSLSPADHSSK